MASTADVVKSVNRGRRKSLAARRSGGRHGRCWAVRRGWPARRTSSASPAPETASSSSGTRRSSSSCSIARLAAGEELRDRPRHAARRDPARVGLRSVARRPQAAGALNLKEFYGYTTLSTLPRTAARAIVSRARAAARSRAATFRSQQRCCAQRCALESPRRVRSQMPEGLLLASSASGQLPVRSAVVSTTASPSACMGATCFYDMNHNGRRLADSTGAVYSTGGEFTDVITRLLRGLRGARRAVRRQPARPQTYRLVDADRVLEPGRRARCSTARRSAPARVRAWTLILDNAMKKVVGDMSDASASTTTRSSRRTPRTADAGASKREPYSANGNAISPAHTATSAARSASSA